MKRTVIVTLVAALVFGILATWIGPKAISYWYRPPVPSGAAAAFNCTEAVDWAMNRLIWTQLIGTLTGALFGLVIGILVSRKKPETPAPVTPKPAA